MSQLVNAAKRVSGIALQGLEYRLELLVAELQEETRRFVVVFAIVQVALFSAFMAFLCLNALVLVLLPDAHRVTAAVVMVGFYLAVAIGLAFYVRRRLRTAPRPFAATLDEFKKDRAALGRSDP